MRRLDPVVYLGRVRELQRIEETGDAVGSARASATATRWRPLRRTTPISARCGGGSRACRSATPVPSAATSPTARRSATANPSLIAAGATLQLRRGGERRSLPLEDFFVAYGKQDRRAGEFVESITVPKPEPGTRYRAYKISKRFDQDISAVMAAFSAAGRTTARWPTCASPMAAWPRRPSARPTPRRRSSASPGPRRRSRPRVDRLGERLPADHRYASVGRLPPVGGPQSPAPPASRDHERRRDPSRRRPEPRSCLSGSRAPSTIRAPMTAPRRHVSGEALYIDDLPEPAGLLHIQLGLSTKAHAQDRQGRSGAGPRGGRAWCAC